MIDDNFSIKRDDNGSLTIVVGSNSITVDQSGDITISTENRIFLAKECKKKFDDFGLSSDELARLETALASKIIKRQTML